MTKNKQNKTNDKTETKEAKGFGGNLRGIIGIVLLLGVLSIGYSTTVIVMGTDGWIPIVMVVPQSVLAVAIAAWKFSK